MLKEAEYVRILGSCCLFDALVMHVYKNYLILEISINNRKDYVVSLYRSLSQTPDEFGSFINNLEKFIANIYSRKANFVLMIGDFHAKSYK